MHYPAKDVSDSGALKHCSGARAFSHEGAKARRGMKNRNFAREWGTEKRSRAEAQGRGGRKYKRLSALVFIRGDSLHSRARAALPLIWVVSAKQPYHFFSIWCGCSANFRRVSPASFQSGAQDAHAPGGPNYASDYPLPNM